MTIDIQYVQMPTSEAMNTLMTARLNRLANKYDWIIRARVHFKQENDPTGKGKIWEIEVLRVPGYLHNPMKMILRKQLPRP